MKWIFNDLKEVLKEAIAESEPDDCVSIVLFGDTVTTLGCFRSMDEPRKAKALKLVDSLRAESLYTNLQPAISRGAEYLYDYFCHRLAEKYILVLVTDGKDHPPPGFLKEHSLEQAITQHPSFLPGKQWSLRYIALKGELDLELVRLVKKYRGSFFDVEEIRESSNRPAEEVIDSILKSPDDWELFDAVMVDQVGEVKVKDKRGGWRTAPNGKPQKISSGSRVMVAADSKAVISLGPEGKVGLEENTEIGVRILQRSAPKRSAMVQLELKKGTIWNAVSAPPGKTLNYEIFSPTAITRVKGTILRVSFDSKTLEQSVAVVKGSVEASPVRRAAKFDTVELKAGDCCVISPRQEPSLPEPIPRETSLEWVAWGKALLHETPLSKINFEPVFFTPHDKRIEIGPITPGGKFVERRVIELSEKYHGSPPIFVGTEIKLPRGVKVDAWVNPVASKDLERDLIISLTCAPFVRHTTAGDYVGRISFSSADPIVKFTSEYVDLTVLNPNSILTLFGWDCVAYIKYQIAALVCLVIIAIAALILAKQWKKTRGVYDYLRSKAVKTKLVHLIRARPSGQMVLLSAMPESKGTAFDLAAISQKNDKVILGIGGDASNTIALSHPSVQPFHCIVWASRKRNPTRVYVEPCSDGYLAIDGKPVVRTRRLRDRNTIEIGEYRFLFLDTQFHHQVVVHMNDGELHEGILEHWNVSQRLLYMTEKPQEEFLTLHFSDISYVNFYRDESERTLDILPRHVRNMSERHKKAVIITLGNGQKLEGFVHRRYRYRYKYTSGVFLLPLDGQTKTQFTFIPGSSIDSLVIVAPSQISGSGERTIDGE